jgi:ribosomal protein L7/L12
MNTDRASALAKYHLTRLLTAAVKADDLTAAGRLLTTLEHLKVAADSLRSGGNPEVQPWGLTSSEARLVQNPNTYINAIKALRERTSLGLREAKDRVDAYREHLYATKALTRPSP